MENNQIFELTLNENYISGFDICAKDSTSFSVEVISKPKRQFGIKKIKGFRRVEEIGWSYVTKLIKN